MLSLRLLGPVGLMRDGQPLPLPTHKAQALLLLLALGGPGHRARLAAWLWPQADDSAGRRNLRRELARLREAGAGPALLSQGEVLALAPAVHCDAQAFAELADAGRSAEALAHWRGPLADGLQTGATDAFDDWLASQRQRLAARRRQLLAAEATTAEAAGDLARALATLQQLLADDPLQEHLHRQVMRLHAAEGRADAALAQHARCRAVLQAELGVAPTAETEALAERIRRHRQDTHPATAATPGWPTELPLTGRDQAWAQLAEAWQAQRLIVVEGEAGIGKTRLARDFAASRGAYALAQCRRSDAGVPYASFTRLLRRLAGQALAQAGLPPWVRLELAHVLPELGDGPQRIGSAEEQRRFCEACAAAWQALAAGSFDTVVIDDWHLADDASQALLGFIIEQRADRRAEQLAVGKPGTAATGAVREIFIQRPEWPSPDAAARQQALQAGSQALVLRLAPLDSASVYALVKRLSGAPDPRRFAQRLDRATGGNPFFLGETLRQWRSLRLLSLGDDGTWQTPFDNATDDYAELPVPDSVRATVIARVQRQAEPVRRLLEAAAQATEPFTAALLAGACDLSEVQALAAIEAAVAAQLLRARDGGWAFAHDLVQTALDNALDPARRRLVHCRLALGGEAAGLDSANIARHWEAGGQPQRAVAHRIAAAEAALALYADADAQAHWQAALDDQPSLAQRVRILGQRWHVLQHRGDLPGLQAAVDELDAAAAQGQASPSPGHEAVALDAALHAAEILAQGQRNDDALRRTQACLAHPALTNTQRAQALRVQSQALTRLGRTDEAIAAAEAALAAGGLGPLQQGDLQHALSYSHFLAGAPQASLDHARLALASWQAAGARRPMAQAQASIGRALDMLDQREAAWAALELAWQQAAELRMIDLQRVVANNLANNRVNHGGPARAIEVIREAQALSPHFTRPSLPVFYLGIQSLAQAQLGELGAALALADQALARALALGETIPIADCLLMTLDLRSQLGDQAGVQALLDALAGRSLAGLDYFGVKVALALAGHALHQGRLADARTHLATIGPVDALGMPPDRNDARLRAAQLALADGDAGAALALLAPLDGLVLYTDQQARSCTLRLLTHQQLGRQDSDALHLADQALASDATGRQLPALARLGLLRARRDAALAGGDATTARQLTAQAAQLQARLAASLGPWQALAGALDETATGPA